VTRENTNPHLSTLITDWHRFSKFCGPATAQRTRTTIDSHDDDNDNDNGSRRSADSIVEVAKFEDRRACADQSRPIALDSDRMHVTEV